MEPGKFNPRINLPTTDHDKDYDAIEEAFVKWLSKPKKLRVPKTQKEFALLHGVSENYLSNVKKRPSTKEAIRTLHVEILQDDVGLILKSLASEAKQGSYQHQKMALEMLGYIGSAQKEHTREEMIRDASSEDIAQDIKRLIESINKESGGADSSS